MNDLQLNVDKRDIQRSCTSKRPYSKDHVIKVVDRMKAEGKLIEHYQYMHGKHFHIAAAGHPSRLTEPKNTCDICKREIRVKRYISHIAKCKGLNTGVREVKAVKT